jgi:hypothetical protein
VSSTAVATAAISAGAGLLGVGLGYIGSLARDVRQEKRERTASRHQLRGAARLVYVEVSGFQTALHIAAAVPRLVKDETVIGPLTARDRLDVHIATLARDEHFDIDIVETAYTSARLAADALLHDAPPDETRDNYDPKFAEALDMLRAIGQIWIYYDEDSRKLARPRPPGEWPPEDRGHISG